MGRFKALCFASVLALGAAPAALAADLLPPPPPVEPPPLRGAVIEEPSGFYLRGDVGVAVHHASDLRSTFADGSTLSSLGAWEGGVSVSDSALAGIGFGYQFNSWVRADFTAEYRSSAQYNSKIYYAGAATGCATGVVCVDDYRGLLRSGLFLANLYADLGTWAGVTPYVGGGVGLYTYSMSGMYDHNWSNGGWGAASDKTGGNFAWSIAAGVAYAIAPNLKLDLSYRYVNMGTLTTSAFDCVGATSHCETQHFALESQDVRLGLRWMLAPVVAMAQPIYPVRARY